ncbi:serine/threonine protein phosphatase [Bradyrhizobium sp. 200]|uniref:metallophosphoesterase family protein n=1 Tax=Bradyrhizobium sp. 200 TaxID=2782665 RepID=UPI001FFF6BFD|nr:metallophosphoesterase family protein [Bradyrhizobium sp. 200]UPJ51706.1 serine/threonine protein phosphatase [Bradyrhizobium sp. 200]
MWRPFRKAAEVNYPKLPSGSRVYAIGDVHGRADLLQETFSKIDRHRVAYPIANALEIMLGDYIDRGPSSFDVIELLSMRVPRGTICLKGNHEAFLLEFLKDPTILNAWQRCGGLETLASYGLEPSLNLSPQDQESLAVSLGERLPAHHYKFLTALPLSFALGDYFFVHAGVRPGVALSNQRAEDLLWIREDFLRYEGSFGKVVVHGHTPVSEPEIRNNRINIDTGAFATGNLTCAVFENDQILFL